ncbi:MAG: DUF6513 domain-containing protein, partial [Rubripirellula sp.]
MPDELLGYMTRHIHFVTGKLAEPSLRRVVEDLAQSVGFEYSIGVMPITVAALLTPRWIAARLKIPAVATEVLLPGYCDTDLASIEAVTNLPVRVGPRDLRALPEYFGQQRNEDYGAYAIEIIAEINHAPRMSIQEIVRLAKRYKASGADVIDVGCDPSDIWVSVADCVKAVKHEGLRVSIDSLNPREIGLATAAGAELVLSVNSSNRVAAVDWGCEVVVIPDDPKSLAGFDETIEFLASRNIPMRLDPILEPIGCGFAESLGRYIATRQRYPDAEIMMGIGNLTELTDVDSAGINVMLLGICEELGIRSVLTTEVINWARSSVRECDLARRLVHFAVRESIPPKRVDDQLVALRDSKLYPQGEASLAQLAASLKDNNYRVFAEQDRLRLLAAGVDLQSDNAFDLFRQLMATQPTNVDASHAFY